MKRSAILLLPMWLACAAGGVSAQGPCRGDVDDSGVVTDNDLAAAVEIVFADELDVDIDALMRADANDDGSVTAADLVAIVHLQGFMCPPGPSRTPTATSSRTGTATRTPTRPPTSTPTQACTVQQVSTGVTNGSLTTGDCRRSFRGSVRFTDQYVIMAPVDQAIRVQVTSTGGAFPPNILVVDPGGYFGEALGDSPIEFVSTTSIPYTIFVTSDPDQDVQTGGYTMTISSRACVFETASPGTDFFDGTECPNIGSANVGGVLDPADFYRFEVTEPLTAIEIRMEQSQEDSLIDPGISVYTPDGYEAFPPFQADDAAPGGFGFDAMARFVAVQTGTYTLMATSGGCDGSDPEDRCGYRLRFTRPQCPSTNLGTIPEDSPKIVAGTIYGDTQRTSCPAPLPVPGLNQFGDPEVNSASDVFVFTAAPGEVFSATMDSDGDSQLSLFRTMQSGNPFVTLNDEVFSGFTSQVATTLTQPGDYLLYASNRAPLERPDPNDPQDIGEFVDYEAFVQKCRLTGGLVPSTGNPANGRFGVTTCVGYGGYPFQAFAFDGTAGQVVATQMRSTAVDSSLRVIGPGLRVGANDTDPFEEMSDARLVRTLPSTGVYYAEMSTSRDEFEPDLVDNLSYTASARACAAKAAVVGAVAESFDNSDCDLGGGRKFDAYTFDGVAGLPARPFVVSVMPPANGCVLGLLPEGGQLFRQGCSKDVLDIPVVADGTAGFVIAADDASTRGAYSATVQVCALPTVPFGATRTGSLATAGCSDAAGMRSDWALFRDRRRLVHFNEGVTLRLDAAFPSAATIFNAAEVTSLTFQRDLDPNDLIDLDADLGALVKIRGAGAGDTGAYTLAIDPPIRRQ